MTIVDSSEGDGDKEKSTKVMKKNVKVDRERRKKNKRYSKNQTGLDNSGINLGANQPLCEQPINDPHHPSDLTLSLFQLALKPLNLPFK